ncbi:MAG: sigma-70 family RNA polymerase sigma factor [Candidatus Dormibacteria bacterium]
MPTPSRPPDEELLALREMVAGYPPLDAAAVARLLGEVGYEDLDQDPRRQLVQHHLWMVLEAATSAARPGTSTADLFQEGTTALLKLVHGLSRHDPLEPTEFQRQVRAAADAAIKAALDEETRIRDQDQQWARDGERVFALETEIRLETGESPTDQQLATRLGWAEERVRQVRLAVSEAAAAHDRELLETLEEMEEE